MRRTPGENFVLAIDRAVGRPREVDPIAQVVVDALIPVGGATGVGGVPLVVMHEDRDTGKPRVAADVVEVEVAVDHGDDIADVQVDRPKFVADCTPLGPVGLIDERVAFAETGVDQDHAFRVPDGERIDDARLSPKGMEARRSSSG
jgi:hypothetical protein